MLPGDPCSSHSDQEPEKSTDNPSEDNVHEDDPETGRDQDSETPKEETVNEQQVEADQELDQEDGDDHQEEEVEEPTVPSGQLIACGLVSSSDEELTEDNTAPSDERAEEYCLHSNRKRERESSEEENKEEQEQEDQEEKEHQVDEVEEQLEQHHGEGDNADQNPPPPTPPRRVTLRFVIRGPSREFSNEVTAVGSPSHHSPENISEQRGGDDEKTLSRIIEKSGGDSYYDDNDPRDIEILKAMNIYHENNRNFPFNNELHDFLRKSSTVEISEEELEIKYLILHAKFQKIVEEKGEGYLLIETVEDFKIQILGFVHRDCVLFLRQWKLLLQSKEIGLIFIDSFKKIRHSTVFQIQESEMLHQHSASSLLYLLKNLGLI
ncbi:hypothetical protein Fot_39884 [Forsythia ovata]|uniref:Uncharacterized protein n=1 Tax=Forsythia ovata TaxID=205694 RepID=A0ABD1S5Y6_9LAMI